MPRISLINDNQSLLLDKPTKPTSKNRLLALDVFRGITLFMMCNVNNQIGPQVFPQLEHADWNGLTLTDLVFPFFIFAMGMAFRLVCEKQSSMPMTKVLKRSSLLFFWGLVPIFYSRVLSHSDDIFSQMRIMGVLQRIALTYFLISSLYVLLPKSWFLQSLLVITLSVIYLMFMLLAPVPGCGSGVLTPECNFSGYLDRLILGRDHIYRQGHFDPEGLFGTLSSLSTAFLGVILADRYLKSSKKLVCFSVFSFICLISGYILHLFVIPVNKSLWTTSYSLVSAGFAGFFFLFLFIVIDMWKVQSVFAPFKAMGSNSLIIFVGSGILVISLLNLYWAHGNWYALPYYYFSKILCPKLASLCSALLHSFFWMIVTAAMYKRRSF
ncbi:hypothetical protein GEMRC1_012380 [Eukaryota sp. GEM-RC1]